VPPDRACDILVDTPIIQHLVSFLAVPAHVAFHTLVIDIVKEPNYLPALQVSSHLCGKCHRDRRHSKTVPAEALFFN